MTLSSAEKLGETRSNTEPAATLASVTRSAYALNMRTILGFLLMLLPITTWAASPDGTWLISQRIAFDVFPCQADLCGKVVWLRNPDLRKDCGRTIVWGLISKSAVEWDDGWLFDPEDGKTYSVNARVDTPDRIIARIYEGMPLFGRTEYLTRIAPNSLAGWCG